MQARYNILSLGAGTVAGSFGRERVGFNALLIGAGGADDDVPLVQLGRVTSVLFFGTGGTALDGAVVAAPSRSFQFNILINFSCILIYITDLHFHQNSVIPNRCDILRSL